MTKKTKKTIRIIGTTGTVYVTFRYLLPLVVPFVLAVIAARMLRPVVDRANERLKIPKRLTAIVVLLLALSIFFVFSGMVFVACLKQGTRLLRSMPYYQNLWYGTTENFCCRLDRMFGFCQGLTLSYMEQGAGLICDFARENMASGLTVYGRGLLITLGKFFMSTFIFFIATISIMGEKKELSRRFRHSYCFQEVQEILVQLRKTGFAYMKAQGIIIFIVAVICVLGLTVIGNPYALLFGIAIAIIDAFPVVGSGSILVPWAAFHVFNGGFMPAAVLVTTYVITLIIREVLEPKLLGNCLGIHPVFMLVAIFAGVKLFGVSGILLGPLALIMIQYILKMEERKEERL